MTKLDPQKQTWLDDAPTRALFSALPEGALRFVGGCVRNALLDAEVSDFDLATTLEPPALMAALKSKNIAVHETGIAHGTVTAVCQSRVFEITTLRRDVSTDGRRASIAFTTDWDQDAQRRDFTINAIYADSSGTLYDPTGQGLADIKTKTVRFVGNAEDRVIEDHLRILRYFRFCAHYAPRAVLDKQALAACREHKQALKKLSSERVWSEIKKILAAPDPHRIVNSMLVGGVLEKILPEASNAEGLKLYCDIEAKHNIPLDPYLRLMAMSARDEMAMAGLGRRLKISNVEKSRLMGWVSSRTDLKLGQEHKVQKIAIYEAGRQAAMDRAVIRAAGAGDPVLENKWIALYHLAKDWQWPEFPITGQDLILAGIPKGERIGKMQTALKALWVRSGFSADKDRLMAALALFNR